MSSSFLGQKSKSDALDSNLITDRIVEETELSNQKHDRTTYIYSFSKLFERASYYGFRSLFVLYMISETLHMPRNEALKIYGWLTLGIILSKIIGAVFGDLLIGNRKAIITGGVLQVIGALILSYPSLTSFYFGTIIIIIGSGFYSPNLISEFGKLYLNKTKIIDSGFTIFYLSIIIGSLIGPLTVGYIGEHNFGYGFILSGIFMTISTLLFYFSKRQKTLAKTNITSKSNNELFYLLIAIVLVGIFWSIYNISDFYIFDLQNKFRESSQINIPTYLWHSRSYLTFPAGIILAITWSYLYKNQLFKLTIGFLFAALSYGILFLIPSHPANHHILIYLLSVLFIGISEVHISPIINSIVTQFSNPKYLAIVMSLVFIPLRIIAYLFSLFNHTFVEEPRYAILFSIIITSLIAVGLLIFILSIKKSKSGLKGSFPNS